MLEREHAAPRRAKQVDAIEPELIANRDDLIAEDIDIPLDVLRPVRLAAADLVVEDDGTLVREPLERREVVVRRAGSSVKRQQGNGAGVAVLDNAVPRAVPAVVDETLGDRDGHRRSV